MATTFWDLVYALRITPWDTGVVPPEVKCLVRDRVVTPPARALDVGCGTGTSVVYLARQGFDVVGVDVSRLAVRRASARIARAGVDARCHVFDATRLHGPESPVEGRFRFVLDVGCFHGMDASQRAAYAEMVSAMLEPGGYLLQYVHTTGGISVSGSGRRPIASWKRLLLQLLRLLSRRSRPPRPTHEQVEAALRPTCRLVWVEGGEDAGRPAACFLWQREPSHA